MLKSILGKGPSQRDVPSKEEVPEKSDKSDWRHDVNGYHTQLDPRLGAPAAALPKKPTTTTMETTDLRCMIVFLIVEL